MHFPSEQQELLSNLIDAQRVASLATMNAAQKPMVSMVPFAVLPDCVRLIVHVSNLAAHTANMRLYSDIALMIMQTEKGRATVHDLPRLTLQARAVFLQPESEILDTARGIYLGRFPEAEPMTKLGDFQFVALEVQDVRFVAGFGAARNIPLNVFQSMLLHARQGSTKPV